MLPPHSQNPSYATATANEDGSKSSRFLGAGNELQALVLGL